MRRNKSSWALGGLLCLGTLAAFWFVPSRRGPDSPQGRGTTGEGTSRFGSVRSGGGDQPQSVPSKSDRRPPNPAGSGLITTASGFQYVVLHEGSGPLPGPKDKATVHYTGTLEDGTVFDSSIDRGKPAMFHVDWLIKGFAEGLQLMKAGSKYKFVIPPELGYGDQKRDKIPANSITIYEVELLEVQAAP